MLNVATPIKTTICPKCNGTGKVKDASSGKEIDCRFCSQGYIYTKQGQQTPPQK
jgi:hypothetical protein